MRAAAVVLAAGVVLAGWGAPAAAADPVTPPEVANAEGVVFKDNPALIDPRPMPVESWSRVSNDRALAVQFTSGTPACNGVHATTTETADTVTVTLTGGSLPAQARRSVNFRRGWKPSTAEIAPASGSTWRTTTRP